MPDTQFVLITGRSTKQGKSLHLGKEAEEYREEVSTLQMNLKDMDALGLQDGGQAQVTSSYGSIVVKLKKTDIPQGIVFIPYGELSNALIGSDTQATGMPDSKGITVEVKRHG
ncbi:MAG: formylmethanofuran dehydrogenase [Candidatus Methylomirabilota bacterium]|nr:formylmethanofuran dehydrogenase [Candidatus Methylomirabilis sp.]NJD67083.1 formylmethanofuran dehydrogenase [candidate division NC10 bacterium]PWB48722.1 MAG: formylmethanofuran dehydrogenase [candidate division NC10 bacterium]